MQGLIHWLLTNRLIIAGAGFVGGLIARQAEQFTADAWRKRRRIAEIRGELYRSIAEILVAMRLFIRSARRLDPGKDGDALKALLADYSQSAGVAKYDEQLSKARENRARLAREANAFEAILGARSRVANAEGNDRILQATRDLLNTFELEIAMGHLIEGDLRKQVDAEMMSVAMDTEKAAETICKHMLAELDQIAAEMTRAEESAARPLEMSQKAR
jgi:hypothetical protein